MQHMWIKANFKFTHCLQADKTVNSLCFNWFFASLVQIFVLSIKSNGKADDCSGIHQKMITCSAAQLKWAYSCFGLSVMKHCTVPAQRQQSRNTQKVTGVALMHRGTKCRGGGAAASCSFPLSQVPYTNHTRTRYYFLSRSILRKHTVLKDNNTSEQC